MPTTTLRITRPQADEHAPYYSRYIEQVPGDDALAAIRAQIGDTLRLLSGLTEARALHRYAPGKWSVKEVVNHVCDAERVFAYRALRIGRGDTTPLPGFDENVFAQAAGTDRRAIAQVAEELRAVRAATLSLLESFDEEAIGRRGTASDNPVSVRALAWIIAGHELHHAKGLRQNYGLGA